MRNRLVLGLIAAAVVLFAAPPVLRAQADAPSPSVASAPAENMRSYDGIITRRMRMFHEVYGQLRLIIMGDSRGVAGIDPRVFFGGSDPKVPLSFILGEDTSGYELHEVLFNEYVTRVPHLQWVVYQMSPRLFNSYHHCAVYDSFIASPGYKYDHEHGDEVWSHPSAAPLTVDELLNREVLIGHPWALRRWNQFCAAVEQGRKKNEPNPFRRVGDLFPEPARAVITKDSGNERPSTTERVTLVNAVDELMQRADFYRPEDFGGVTLPADVTETLRRPRAELTPLEVRQVNRRILEALFGSETLPRLLPLAAWGWHEPQNEHVDLTKVNDLIATASKGRYKFSPERWASFERIVDALGKRGVKILAFTSPMHPAFAQAPCADDDGTSDTAYAALMQRLADLQQKYPNFHFLDLHKDGRNGYTSEDFINWDHLNGKGAAKLSPVLEAERARIDAQPKLDVTPPRLTSVTAVGEATKVSLTFSEPLPPAMLAEASHFAISAGIVVQAAQAKDEQTAVLTTTALRENQRYALSIKDLRDRADNDLANPQAEFRFARRHILTGTMPAAYVWSELNAGVAAYVDQNATYTDVSPSYRGMKVLRTAQRDAKATGESFLTFQSNYPVRVYVAHDDLIMVKPAWLNTFTYTWDFLTLDKRQLRLAFKDFPAGKIVLGGNAGAADQMYTVLVEPRGSCELPDGKAK